MGISGMGSKPQDVGNERLEAELRREALRLLARLIAKKHWGTQQPQPGAQQTDCGEDVFGDKA